MKQPSERNAFMTTNAARRRTNLNKKRRVILFAVIFILITLFATRPTEANYESWLAKKHGIECVYSPTDGRVCSKEDEALDWRSRAMTHAFFHTAVRDRYSTESGHEIEIKAVGFLKLVFDRTESQAI
ncbi:hypothetical protein [Paenibacillus sp. NPDC058071]|uniref:hypothetical protein n=1 Tax=Paenibacillus sp. NPDC058071 TaxID=3346326 RepID=UPI0036D9723B